MDGAFYVSEDPDLEVSLKILQVRNRLVRNIELSVLFRQGDNLYSLHNLRTDQVPIIRWLHVRDPEQVAGFIQRFTGHF